MLVKKPMGVVANTFAMQQTSLKSSIGIWLRLIFKIWFKVYIFDQTLLGLWFRS
jgi:hypothetical protein